ncbi:hypothetical protein J6590_018417 [Homalodisca vitripennis]|nr:hypothetical protein J6590_018417 [Homalodisca vitripennis]
MPYFTSDFRITTKGRAGELQGQGRSDHPSKQQSRFCDNRRTRCNAPLAGVKRESTNITASGRKLVPSSDAFSVILRKLPKQR